MFVGSLDAFSGHELCTEHSLFNPILGKPKFAPEQGHPTADGYATWTDWIHTKLIGLGVIFK
jgi:hypothetical protein